ncbi:tetratricopeptide repeat protein [Roseiarcus sp.]|uniref:tetratricopeptide repeat protein n=1 Tax=Roseiarcus sp. TaxID=1969460 RepID=UPI003F9545E5
MRVDACDEAGSRAGWRGRESALLAALLLLVVTAPALAFDGSTNGPPAKISPKSYVSAEQALRAGLDDLNAGNAASCVDALTYAAAGGQPVARWKLGEMYADGVGVARDDVKAYYYFNQLVEDYDEDALDPRNRGAVASAFVAVGVYSLTGIPNSDIRPDPERARELFQYAASTFGDPDAEYNLAHMYMVGAGGLAKDKLVAIRWLMLASGKGHRPSQALLGHLLFTGDGVLPQRARGLMWLTIANNRAEGPKDDWIRDLYRQDLAAASFPDREMATAMLDERAKGPPLPSVISRTVVQTLQILRPLGVPVVAAAPPPPQPPPAQ